MMFPQIYLRAPMSCDRQDFHKLQLLHPSSDLRRRIGHVVLRTTAAAAAAGHTVPAQKVGIGLAVSSLALAVQLARGAQI